MSITYRYLPGYGFRIMPNCVAVLGFLLALTCLPSLLYAQGVPVADEPGMFSDQLPRWELRKIDENFRPEISYFGQYATGLGDLNGDGYDDFAVSSGLDSTFIFFGGYPFPAHDYSYVIKGGSHGVYAADLNHDSKIDIVTCCQYGKAYTYPKYNGAIRIYYQKDGPVPFTWEEDVLFEGAPYAELGLYCPSDPNRYGGVRLLDYNGDGWIDILTVEKDTSITDSQGYPLGLVYKGVLLFGGPNGFSLENRVEFLTSDKKNTSQYADEFLVGDLNGDGYDDIMLMAEISTPKSVVHWDIFFGNAAGHNNGPDRILNSRKWKLIWDEYVLLMDINGDGYCDIISSRLVDLYDDNNKYGYIPVFLGSAVLPENIEPNDSIPNWAPGPRSTARYPLVVNDMNGDGYDDLLIDWGFAARRFFYPGGYGFHKAEGWIPHNDMSEEYFCYGVGDVDGNGYNDVIQLAGGGSLVKGGSSQNRYALWSGTKELRSTLPPPVRVATIPVANVHCSLAPNPLPAGTALRITAGGFASGTVSVRISDMLGRICYNEDLHTDHGRLRQWVQGFAVSSGAYVVTLQQGQLLLTQLCVVF